MVTASTPSFIEIARALGPQIQSYSQEIEQGRRLPLPLVETMAKSGLFRLWIPQKQGGVEADPVTFVRIVEEISKVDGAVGWCLMIGGGYGLFGGYLPDEAAREIYGTNPDVITGGAFSPSGQAVVTEGGYRVTGRWQLGSGCQHTNWLVGGCRIFDGDQPRLSADGTPVRRMLFFPTEDCEIIDTWHTTGLRGTGSHDYAVSDLFVPAPRSLSFREPPSHSGPLYALPTIALFGVAIAAVPLGIARHAIDVLVELADVTTASDSQEARGHRAMVQADVARAEALLRSGRAFLYETLEEAWQVVTAGDTLCVKQRAMLWLASTQAAIAATQAVELMFSAGGSTSVYTSSPLERCLRDIRTAGQHVCVVPSNFEMVGQALLGFDMSTSILLRLDDRSEG